MATALDTTRNCSQVASCLRQRGYDTIIRYYCRPGITWKKMTLPEAVAITRAGMKLGAVYQNRQNQGADFSEGQGKAAGADAHDYAENTIFQPAGSAIYFSADFDPSESIVRNNIVPFFKGVHKGFKEAAHSGAPAYRVGVYGSGRTCRILTEEGLVDLTWITQSTGFAEYNKYVNSRKWALKQNMPATICGVECDPDEVNEDFGDAGAFVLDIENLGPAAPPEMVVSDVDVYRVIASSGLRLRGGPGIEYEIRTVLPFNSSVRVVSRQGDWGLVDVTGDGGADGFVLFAFLDR